MNTLNQVHAAAQPTEDTEPALDPLDDLMCTTTELLWELRLLGCETHAINRSLESIYTLAPAAQIQRLKTLHERMRQMMARVREANQIEGKPHATPQTALQENQQIFRGHGDGTALQENQQIFRPQTALQENQQIFCGHGEKGKDRFMQQRGCNNGLEKGPNKKRRLGTENLRKQSSHSSPSFFRAMGDRYASWVPLRDQTYKRLVTFADILYDALTEIIDNDNSSKLGTPKHMKGLLMKKLLEGPGAVTSHRSLEAEVENAFKNSYLEAGNVWAAACAKNRTMIQFGRRRMRDAVSDAAEVIEDGA